MTDGNTYAINKHIDDLEDYAALQEVTAELEQAEARIEELKAKLAKAVDALEWVKFGGGPRGEGYHEFACTTLAELSKERSDEKGQDDE